MHIKHLDGTGLLQKRKCCQTRGRWLQARPQAHASATGHEREEDGQGSTECCPTWQSLQKSEISQDYCSPWTRQAGTKDHRCQTRTTSGDKRPKVSSYWQVHRMEHNEVAAKKLKRRKNIGILALLAPVCGYLGVLYPADLAVSLKAAASAPHSMRWRDLVRSIAHSSAY
jgi:hypothetical protein